MSEESDQFLDTFVYKLNTKYGSYKYTDEPYFCKHDRIVQYKTPNFEHLRFLLCDNGTYVNLNHVYSFNKDTIKDTHRIIFSDTQDINDQISYRTKIGIEKC